MKTSIHSHVVISDLTNFFSILEYSMVLVFENKLLYIFSHETKIGNGEISEDDPAKVAPKVSI